MGEQDRLRGCDEGKTNFFAKLTLDLRSKFNVSNSALDFMTNELRDWLQSEEGTSCPPAKRQRIDCESSDFANVLLHLNSQNKRTNYYKSNFNLIEPEELFINSNLKTRMKNPLHQTMIVSSYIVAKGVKSVSGGGGI